jgi:hypothetical protein
MRFLTDVNASGALAEWLTDDTGARDAGGDHG